MRPPKPRPDRKEPVVPKPKYGTFRRALIELATAAVLYALAFAIIVLTCTGAYCILRSVV